MIFPSHEALVDPSGRADAATVERGGAHRGKDSQPGQECQPTLLERRASFGCPPRRRQTDLLVNESAPSAAAARGLHKGRHRLMTAERRLPSMHCAVGSPPYGRGSTRMTPWTGGLPSQKKDCQSILYASNTNQNRAQQELQTRRKSHVNSNGRTSDGRSADRTRVQKPRNEKTREKKHVTPTIKEPLHKEKQKLISRRAAESRKRQSVSNKTKRRTPRP